MQTTLSRLSGISRNCDPQGGVSLLELMLTIGILLIIATSAIATVRTTMIREREWELRRDLREMRDAIDKYKDLADKNLVRTAVGSEGYPPSLDDLVKGVYLGSSGPTIRFLRRIPVDPMTKRTDWMLQAVQDDPDSTTGSGGNVFDVHSSSPAIALDGTPYSTW